MGMKTIAVIDYGMGNLRSVQKALEHVASSARVYVSGDPEVLRRADSVVFPGQGAISGCFTALAERGLREVVLEAAASKPFLGICLGLQALFETSEEGGGVAGLGLLPGRVRLFSPISRVCEDGPVLKVPHMGWNRVHCVREHPLWQGIPQDSRFYFVHSYYVECDRQSDIAATTEYGVEFVSVAARENLFALQCHPEKSQRVGLQLLRNFVAWDGSA
jgi:imidazole glycerol-phosphate synthase subunit HisH